MTDIETIGKQIDETRHLLQDNTNKLIERDSHLDDIERQTANLELNSHRFKRKTRGLKHRMMWNYSFFAIGIMVSLFVMIVIIIIIKHG